MSLVRIQRHTLADDPTDAASDSLRESEAPRHHHEAQRRLDEQKQTVAAISWTIS